MSNNDLSQIPSSPYYIHPKQNGLPYQRYIDSNFHRSFTPLVGTLQYLNHSPSIAQIVIYFDHATNIWNDLKECFSQGDLLQIAELQEEIYRLKQGSHTVLDFFTKLKFVWEELDNYGLMNPCTCPSRTYHQQDFVIHFLKGLDERFSVVCSEVLLMDHLPSTKRIFSMVIQHETQHATHTSAEDQNRFINVAEKRSFFKSCGNPYEEGHNQNEEFLYGPGLNPT
ncbi:hypothetical protein HKD37_13G036787 [Glycine soja]